MSFAFLKKAFGIKKTPDDKEFDDFFRVFETHDNVNIGHLSKLIRKKVVRLVVLQNKESSVVFDSYSHKESPRPLPFFTFGGKQLNLADLAFGSYGLNHKRPVLYSTKIHDLRSSGQVLVTRVINDIDEWRNLNFNSNRQVWAKYSFSQCLINQKRSNIQEIKCAKFVRREPVNHNAVAICILINLDFSASNSFNITLRSGFLQSGNLGRRSFSTLFNVDSNQSPTLLSHSTEYPSRNSPISASRFYQMLFENCAQFSLIVETLTFETLISICNSSCYHWGSSTLPESSCVELISKSFNSFLDSFRDICLPKLLFPVWYTLNVSLSLRSDSTSICLDQNQANTVSSWINMNSHTLPRSFTFEGFPSTYENLTDTFVRYCLSPLVVKGSKEHRSFLSRLVTGILMFHPGWLTTVSRNQTHLTADHCSQNNSSSNDHNMTTSLLSQLLTQTGCTATNLNVLAGNIFNCTVISGQSRQYLLALLYFATYFLRFVCLTRSRECVPELGQADLFELEQQKQQARLIGKTRRKSGSTAVNISTSGDAHDSGISSQEDLTTMVYSASTGSSPTHISGMALCMTRRLTRDQCRIAEAAAQLIVNREAAAAAAMTNLLPQNIPVCPTSLLLSNRINNADSSGYNNVFTLSENNQGNRSHFTEVPLLIEKYFEDDEDLFGYSSGEVISSVSTSSPPVATIHTSEQLNLPSFTLNSNSKEHTNVVMQSSRSTDNNIPPDMCLNINRADTNHFSQLPFVNNCLIASSVLDHYHGGHVLQATLEQPESFRPRLEEHLVQWLTYGPLILRGANLSSKLAADQGTNTTVRSQRPINHKSSKHSCWSATGLIINCDVRSVEAFTIVQPNQSNLVLLKENTSQSVNKCSQFKVKSEHIERRETPGLLPSTMALDASVHRYSMHIKSAPLISHLIDKIQSVFESSNCSLLTLHYLEANLQLIYDKSLILTDLLIKEGPPLLQRTDRIISALGCSMDDLPLLFSITMAYSNEAANILHTNHFDFRCL